jgi:hypothetical protein
MRREGEWHPLPFATEGLIEWILVDDDTHTIIRGMFLEGLLQGGGTEGSSEEVNVDRGKREY